MMRFGWAACLVGALALSAGCGDSADTVDGDGGGGDLDSGANGNGNGDGGTGGDGGGTGDDAGGTGSLSCDGTTQCSDGEDNDGDGRVDLEDPSCASCFDDDESSFATGIPGDNKSNDGTQDCFFDGDTGWGNDGCRIPDCCYDSTDDSCTMGDATCEEAFTDECIANCEGATPPGCDCGGCCTVCEVCDPNDPDCTDEDLECRNIYRAGDIDSETCNEYDLSGCPTCEKNPDCSGGDCEQDECVLCQGQDEDDRPDTCDEQDQCNEGQTPCTEDTDCADGQYCALGCCLNQIEITIR